MFRHLMTSAIIIPFLLSVASADYETFNVYGGIGFGFGNGGKLYRSTNTSGGSIEVKDHFFNYGSGLKLDLGCQYFMMDKVALQSSFSYSAGIPSFDHSIENATTETTTSYGYNLWGLNVLVVPKFQVLDLLDTYVGIGFGIHFTTCSFEITRKAGSTTQNAEGTISSSPSFGLSGIFGLDYPLNDKMTLFGELGFQQLSVNLSKYKVKDSDIPGITGGTVYNYEKNAAGDNNFPPEKIPGSNFQIRFGVRYALF